MTRKFTLVHTRIHRENDQIQMVGKKLDIEIGDIIDVYDYATSTWYESVITSSISQDGHLLFFCAHFIGKPYFENQWYFVRVGDEVAKRGTHSKGPYRSNTYLSRRPYVGYPEFDTSAPGASDGAWRVVWENGSFADFVLENGKWTLGASYELDESKTNSCGGMAQYKFLNTLRKMDLGDGSLQMSSTLRYVGCHNNLHNR